MSYAGKYWKPSSKFDNRWQIVPAMIGQMMGDTDPARAQLVFDAMCQMVKLDIAKLTEAYEG